MGGTYRSPTVEYKDRIAAQIGSAAFAGLLNNPQTEYHPSRSPMIERVIHSAHIARKKTTAPKEQPSP